jgi:hypothetical protein
MRRLDKKLADKENQPFCKTCWGSLNSTLVHHQKNLTLPTQIYEAEGSAE